MATIFVVGARGIPDVEGGAEKNAEKLFPLMVAGGHRVALVALADTVRADTFQGVELIRAPRSRLLKTDKLLYYVTAIFMARKVRPDVVHFQGLGSALFLLVYKAMGYRTVVRYGSADYLVGKWGFLGRLGFLLAEFQLRFADAVISVTPALAKRLDDRGIRDNVHVIANAIDDRVDPVAGSEITPIDTPYVLSVGRVTAQKNIDNLLRGFSEYARTGNPAVGLVVAGGLDEVDYVESLKPLLTDRTRLLGRLARSAMGPLYARSAVYVNSSIHEGSSNAVLEAISWQAPILLADIPENRDFGIGDQHYFDPTSPTAIAQALDRAISNPDAFRVDKSQFLTWAEVAAKTQSIYAQVLRPRSRRQAGTLPISATT